MMSEGVVLQLGRKTRKTYCGNSLRLQSSSFFFRGSNMAHNGFNVPTRRKKRSNKPLTWAYDSLSLGMTL